MPSRMHAEYLRISTSNNARLPPRANSRPAPTRVGDLGARGFMYRFSVVGHGKTDHVLAVAIGLQARGLTRATIHFPADVGGHNGGPGIVSGPAHPRLRYRVRTLAERRPKTLAAADLVLDEHSLTREIGWWPSGNTGSASTPPEGAWPPRRWDRCAAGYAARCAEHPARTVFAKVAAVSFRHPRPTATRATR